MSERPIRILCVEDEPVTARLLQKRLVRAGYEVDIAQDGEEGLSKWLAGSYDVLTTDHDMPRKQGLDLIRELASRGPIAPTIMITGHGNESVAVEAMKLGADDYIMKDTVARFYDLLPQRIEEALHRRRILQEKIKAEESLRESEKRYSTIFRGASEGILVADYQARQFKYSNPAACHMLGYTEDELTRPSVTDIHTKDILDKVLARFEARLRGEKGNTQAVPFLRKDGEIVYADVSSDFMTLDGVPCVVGFLSDITDRKKAEESLQAQKDMLETIFETTPYIMMVVNEDGRVESINRAGALFSGSPKEELLGLLGDKVFHCINSFEGLGCGRNAECVNCSVRTKVMHTFQTGQSIHEGEGRLTVRKDGRDLTLDLLISTGLVKMDTRDMVLVTIADITDRKKAEDSLRESEERFRLTFQTSPDSININRLSDGLYIDVNDGFTAITGYSREEVIGKSSIELDIWHNPQDRHRLVESLQKAGYVSNMEAKFRFKDGTLITGLMSARVIMLTGEPYIVSITRNIEEWRKTQQALQESEQRYRTLFEESLDGVYSVLRNGIITDANPSFCQLFGYSTEEMIGKDIRELYLDSDDRTRFQDEIEKNGFIKDHETKLRKRDGTDFECLVTASVHFGNEGSIAGYRGIIRDLTLRKGLQRQLLQAQKMESVGTLAGGIAHDFNNLLQVVLGYSDMLLFQKKPTDPDYEGLQAIRKAGRDGGDLAKRILAFSRRLEPAVRPINLNNEIRRIDKMLRRTLPKMIATELLLADDLLTARPIGNIAAISRNSFRFYFSTGSSESSLDSGPTLPENPSSHPGIPAPRQPGSFLGR